MYTEGIEMGMNKIGNKRMEVDFFCLQLYKVDCACTIFLNKI